MLKNYFSIVIFTIIFTFGTTLSIKGQALKAMPPPPPQEVEDAPPNRGNLIRTLDLSPQQIKRLRSINQERRPFMQAAQRRLREANRALDQAVYADFENEADIQAKIKEVQNAQAEMILNRTATERAIRRILTPQQLVRFRDLRAQFMENENISPEGRRNQDVRNNRRQNRRRNINRNPLPQE